MAGLQVERIGAGCMKVLVTGATGFVGNHVVRELLKRGHVVIATSRTARKAKLSDWFSQVQYVQYDIQAAQEDLLHMFRHPDALIHLAWEGLPNYGDLFHFEQNLPVHYRFLKALLLEGLENLTVAGTCFEYGLQNGCLSEDLATEPTTPYGLAKDTLRRCLEQLQRHYGFSLKWLRLFYVHGEGQSEHSLLSQLGAALRRGDPTFRMSGGEQLRDYLPVEQTAEYIVRIATQRQVAGVINCCSGTPISIRKLVEDYMAGREKNIHLELGSYPYPEYEPMAFWGSTARLQQAVGDPTHT